MFLLNTEGGGKNLKFQEEWRGKVIIASLRERQDGLAWCGSFGSSLPVNLYMCTALDYSHLLPVSL